MSRVNFVDLIPLDKIILDTDPIRRELDSHHIEALLESLQVLGMGPLEPLIVKPLPDGRFQILSGNHRYMALKQGGWPEAPCHVIEPLNEAEEFLMKLHTNTKRKNMDDLELCEALVREKDIYENFYPETRHGKNCKLSLSSQNANSGTLSYSALKAQSLGVNRSTLYRDLQVGQLVMEIPELKEARATKSQVLLLLQRRPEERAVLQRALRHASNKPRILKQFLRSELSPIVTMLPEDLLSWLYESLRLFRSDIPWHEPEYLSIASQIAGEEVLITLSELAKQEHDKLLECVTTP
jgi:hypothetical protein